MCDSCCDQESMATVDFSQFEKLKRLEIGSNCFKLVNEVKVTSLKELVSIVIGEDSFTKDRSLTTRSSNCRFYLKNCPALKELKIGVFSFCGYSVCDIKHVDALEVIEFGDIEYCSQNFNHASLELKSVRIHIE